MSMRLASSTHHDRPAFLRHLREALQSACEDAEAGGSSCEEGRSQLRKQAGMLSCRQLLMLPTACQMDLAEV